MYKIKNFKGFNWLGFWTLYSKEVRRFLNVLLKQFSRQPLQPFCSILFLQFQWIERERENSENYIFSEFLAPGLVCMAIMQNAFANTSSSILISKVQGNIVDVF